MHFYLPVAEMSANILIFLAMGGAVGFLSGLFGVGGGFLMTPLLIFSGIPPAVAVGTESAQITASSVSGAFAQWRRRNIDFAMGTVLLAGGIVGSVLGVQLVGSLRRLGVFDFFVAACYVTFLGVVGTSLFQIVFLTAATTALHASQNQTVDVALAVLLMAGGVVGAQFGAVAGERLKAEQLRFLLAALVLMVGLRFAWQLIAPPADLYSIGAAVGGA